MTLSLRTPHAVLWFNERYNLKSLGIVQSATPPKVLRALPDSRLLSNNHFERHNHFDSGAEVHLA